MSNYIGSAIWSDEIYIIQPPDLIQHGEDGNDSVPNIENLNNTILIKKFKGRIIIGPNNPNSSTLNSYSTDTNTTSNILYFNETIGAFWKPDDSSGSTWTNITKDVVLNIKQLRLNGNERAYTYGQFQLVDSEETGEYKLNIKDNNDRYLKIKANKFIFDKAEGRSLRQTNTPDNEILINFNILQESSNSDSSYGVKHFDNDTGNTRDDKLCRWNESKKAWTLIDETDNLLYINIDQLYVNGIQMQQDYEILITNQEEFDAIFNTQAAGGETTITDETGSFFNSIFIKPGNYTLDNYLLIQKDNFSIICSSGAFIKIDSSIGNTTPIFTFDTGDTGNALNDDNMVLNIDGDNNTVDILFDITCLRRSNLYCKIKNITINQNVVQNGNYINNIEVKHINDLYTVNDNFHNVSNSYITANIENYPGETGESGEMFQNCNNIIINGLLNETITLAAGNFNS